MIHKDFRCEFYFIRHGESESNATPGFAAGANHDAPLTGLGEKQATLLGKRLLAEGVKFDLVYSSTLVRAEKTARLMLDAMGEPDRDFPKVDDIMEQQMPGWRGVPLEEAFTTDVMLYRAAKGPDFVPPEGESLRMVQRRISAWLEREIIYNEDLTSRPQDLKIAVVGHGQSSRCLFQYIMGFRDSLLWQLAIDNTSIGRFVFDRYGWSVVRLNDASHLANHEASFEARP